jgi:YfiH family protein
LNVGLHVGDDVSRVRQNRNILARAISVKAEDFTCGQQVHGANVGIVREQERGSGAKDWLEGLAETDAMITNIPGIPLMVLTADCAAISIYDPASHAIGLVHAGKKGTINGIVTKTIKKMTTEYGTSGKDLIVAVGPSVHTCCYELDIPILIKKQLLEAGVKEENMEFSQLCTACRNDIFYSYRKEKGKTGRFANILMLKI